MAHEVFISYSNKDKPTADAVCAVLESHGIRCWVAPRDVMPGTEYAEAIIDAIHSAHVMVLVFSGHANTSPHIRREVERAVTRGITIIPLRIEEVQPIKALEFYIATPHWLDAFTPPLERHLNFLAQTIGQILQRRDAEAGVAAQQGHATPPPPTAQSQFAPRPAAPAAPAAAPAQQWTPQHPQAPAQAPQQPQWAPQTQGAAAAAAQPPLQTFMSNRANVVIVACAATAFVVAFGIWLVVSLLQGPRPIASSTTTPSTSQSQPTQPQTQTQTQAPTQPKATTPRTSSEPSPKPSGTGSGSGSGSQNPTADSQGEFDVAMAAANAGDYDGAILHYTNALKIDANDPYSYNNRGLAYYHKGMYDQAIDDFSRAIQLKPDFENAFVSRGVSYRLKGLTNLAIVDYNEAIRLKPNDPLAYSNRAWAYHVANRDNDALADISRAIDLEATADRYDTRGVIEEKLGQRDKAIADYRKALALDATLGSSRDALKRLGVTP